jgi:hypothetical protein
VVTSGGRVVVRLFHHGVDGCRVTPKAVRYLAAERGISQFVDIGPGLPSQGNVHQLAQQHNPVAKVAYVDNDASVLVHSRALLDGVPGVTLLPGDLREQDRILVDPDLAALIDFSRPVALLMTLVLHFVPPDDDPYGLVATYRDALCPGSFLVLSHVWTRWRRSSTSLPPVRGPTPTAGRA